MKATTKTTKAGSLTVYNPKNIGKLINMWKRFFDDWAYEALAREGYDYFKMSYMPLIMNISETGSSNNEIAAKARVTKQAMSKVVKELLAKGLISSQKHKTDARVSILFLTPKGKKFIEDTKRCMNKLGDEYKELVGVHNFEVMVDCVFKINQYHEAKTENRILHTL
jgi:DNA-binding MarR family transcriptional regulator